MLRKLFADALGFGKPSRDVGSTTGADLGKGSRPVRPALWMHSVPEDRELRRILCSRMGGTNVLRLWLVNRRGFRGRRDEVVGHLGSRWNGQRGRRREKEGCQVGVGKARRTAREAFPFGRYLQARGVRGGQHMHSKGFPVGRYCPTEHLQEWSACNEHGDEAWSRMSGCGRPGRSCECPEAEHRNAWISRICSCQRRLAPGVLSCSWPVKGLSIAVGAKR